MQQAIEYIKAFPYWCQLFWFLVGWAVAAHVYHH
jgi:hypothetical protein